MQDGRKILRSLILGSSYRFGSYFLMTLVIFLLRPVMVGTLGTRECGLWAAAAEIVGMYSVLELGLNTAVSRFIAASIGLKDDAETNRYFNTGFFLFALVGGIVFVLSCLTIAFASRIVPLLGIDVDMSDFRLFAVVVLILGAQFAVELPFRAFNGLINGALRQDLSALVKTGFFLVSQGVAFLILMNADALLPLFGSLLYPLALGSLLVACVNFFAWYGAARSVFPALRMTYTRIDRAALRRVFHYTTFSFAAMLADIAKTAAPTFLLAGFLNLSAVGQYKMVLTTLTGALGALVAQVTNTVSPLFSRLVAQNDHESARNALFFSMKVATVISVFISFGLIAWSDPFIQRWMEPDIMIYGAKSDAHAARGKTAETAETEEAPVAGKPSLQRERIPDLNPDRVNVDFMLTLYLLVIAMCLDRMQSPGTELLYGTSNHHHYSLLNGVEAVLLFVLTALGLKYRGFLGLGIGALVPVIFTRGIWLPLLVCRVLGIPRHAYRRALLFPLAGCLAACYPPMFITYYLVAPAYPRLFLVGTLAACTYFPVAVLLVFTREERMKVWNAIRHRQ
ncbi:MAG TPA: hypothetical protein DEB39_15045 [Planctomycetaceae bacterium]|nr:hypothetical protein [Planctomycetaceae bacterium]